METRIITAKHMEDFGAYLRSEERSDATVGKYLHDLKTFCDWLSGREVSKNEVTLWKAHLCGQGKSSVTVNGSLAALHSFFGFMGWPDCRVRYLKIQRQMFRDTARELDKGDYARLVETARDSGKKRLALLLETICGTGIRVSELQYITVEAVRRGRADISLKGKVRTILISNKLCRKLLKYAQTQKIASGEIFLTASGKRISRGQIWSEMKRLCELAGVDKTKVFPHNLRHLFARTFYQGSQDIVGLADVLGHSSVETTRIYLITTGSEYSRRIDSMNLIL